MVRYKENSGSSDAVGFSFCTAGSVREDRGLVFDLFFLIFLVQGSTIQKKIVLL